MLVFIVTFIAVCDKVVGILLLIIDFVLRFRLVVRQLGTSRRDPEEVGSFETLILLYQTTRPHILNLIFKK